MKYLFNGKGLLLVSFLCVGFMSNFGFSYEPVAQDGALIAVMQGKLNTMLKTSPSAKKALVSTLELMGSKSSSDRFKYITSELVNYLNGTASTSKAITTTTITTTAPLVTNVFEEIDNLLIIIDTSLSGAKSVDEFDTIDKKISEVESSLSAIRSMQDTMRNDYLFKINIYKALTVIGKARELNGNARDKKTLLIKAKTTVDLAIAYADSDTEKKLTNDLLSYIESTKTRLEQEALRTDDTNSVESDFGLELKGQNTLAGPSITRKFYLIKGLYQISRNFYDGESHHLVKLYDESNDYDLIVNTFDKGFGYDTFTVYSDGLYYMTIETAPYAWTLVIKKL